MSTSTKLSAAQNEPFADAGIFMRETGELQRITIRCLARALHRQLESEQWLVGAVWHEGDHVIRFRAVLPNRLVRRDWFHLAMEVRFLIEGINNHALVHDMKFHRFGPYVDFSAEVEASS